MKKRILKVTGILFCFAALTLPSCEFLENCGTCELVTTEADGTITYGTPLPFCGDDLIEKQNSEPTSIGGITTEWNCY